MKTSVRVKPLSKKQVTNILTAVCGAYSSFSEEQQFEISNLALELQEVVCLDKSRSDVIIDDEKGMFLEVPTAETRLNQPRNELNQFMKSKPTLHQRKFKRVCKTLDFLRMCATIHAPFKSMEITAGLYIVSSALWDIL